MSQRDQFPVEEDKSPQRPQSPDQESDSRTPPSAPGSAYVTPTKPRENLNPSTPIKRFEDRESIVSVDDIPESFVIVQRMWEMFGSVDRKEYAELVMDVEDYMKVFKAEVDRQRGLLRS